jgi:hypothetical protein
MNSFPNLSTKVGKIISTNWKRPRNKVKYYFDD